MKKKTVLCLALAMAVGLTACGSSSDSPASSAVSSVAGEGTAESSVASEAAGETVSAQGTITIGDGSGITGDFGYDFGIAQPDVNMFNLITGYELIVTNIDGEFVQNQTAIKELAETENEDGSITYTVTLNEGLVWNNGETVDADDYVAAYLLRSSAAYGETGAYTDCGYYIAGYEEFNTGASEVFTGVRLLGDDQFSVTLSADYVPSYYQLSYIDTYPIYLEAWAPGASVVDNGEGCQFAEPLTAEAISESVDSERYNPTVTCGAYNLKSFDEGTLTGVFEINPDFKGNFEGVLPTIQTVIYKNTSTETEMDELRTGSVDVILNCTSSDKINAGLDMEEEGGFYSVSYPGCGCSMIFYDCAKGATSSQAVRQAVVYAFDRVEFVRQQAGGFGAVLNGYYSDASFGAQELGSELEEALNSYSYDLDKAVAILEEDGWVLNADGGEFVDGTDDVRYKKMEDGSLQPLALNMAASSDSSFSDLCIQMLGDALPKIGAKFEYTQVDWSLLMDYMYDSSASECNMYVSGSWFGSTYEPSLDYTLDESLIAAGYNNYSVFDEKLYELARAIELTEPGDTETYLENFKAFNVYWNEILPVIPMYSGDYYCFVNERVQNYQASAYANPDYSVLYATISE